MSSTLIRRIAFCSVLFSGWLFSVATALAAGGKPATKLVNVADTRDVPPGFVRWLADLYNTNMILYSLVAVGIMVGMGLVLGFVFDRLISLLGINLGKLGHHE